MARGQLKCKNCGKSRVYGSDELVNIGTAFSPNWAAQCECGQFIRIDNAASPSFPKNHELILTYDHDNDAVSISTKSLKKKLSKGDALTRAHQNDIREYWIQLFFEKHYRDYGFRNVDGPYDTGPDFFCTEKGGRMGIEIERYWRSYLDHGHHQSKSFSDVKYLVVLNPQKPPASHTKFLPKSILYIDLKKFVPWFKIEARKYAKNKEQERERGKLTLILELIKGEFIRRYWMICPDKTRDMAICPQCKSCPYCPELNFDDMAIQFVVSYKYPIWDDSFSLSQLKAAHLDKFFVKNMKAYTSGPDKIPNVK